MRPRTLLVLLALAALGLSSDPARAGERTPPDERGQTSVTVGTATRPDSLNPFVASNRLGRIVTALLYDELLTYDAEQQLLPSLVEDWKGSADGRLWLLELRPGLRWSDGKRVTTRDVIHTLRRIQRDPRSRYSRWLDDVTLVKRFNQRRVGVRFATASDEPPPLPIPILPRHIWSSVQAGDVRQFANDPPVGSGAFAASNTSEPDTLTLTARETHWRGTPPADELILRFYESQEELATALEAGRIDVADDVGPELVERLAASDAISITTTPASAFVSLGMNTGSIDGDGHLALREARVRRAIALALDREALRELAIGEYGAAGSTIVPPALPQHVEPAGDAALPFDPARADGLLRRAGLSDGDGDGIRETSLGLPFELRLYVRRSLPETIRVGAQIAASLKAVGIEVKVLELTDRELSRRIRTGRYDLFVWGWEVGSDPSFIASVLSCGEARPSGLSDTYFCDGDYDELYTRYTDATDPARRDALLASSRSAPTAERPTSCSTTGRRFRRIARTASQQRPMGRRRSSSLYHPRRRSNSSCSGRCQPRGRRRPWRRSPPWPRHRPASSTRSAHRSSGASSRSA